MTDSHHFRLLFFKKMAAEVVVVDSPLVHLPHVKILKVLTEQDLLCVVLF